MNGTEMMSGKRIVIVGASSGLGLYAAEAFAAMGWKVGAAARSQSVLETLKEKYPSNVEWQKIDVTSEDAPQMLSRLISDLGGMDVYFHVSGICIENPTLEIDDDIKTVDTNVGGFTRMIDAAFNYFREKEVKGQIAAITSVAGTKGIADLASYSAAKRYQWTYLQALEQLAKRERLPVSFTEIRPGWTMTPLVKPDRRYIMAMNPEKVGSKVVKAVVKGRRRVVIDSRWAVMQVLWRLLPQWVWARIPLHASYSMKE